jgi:hypothetical protein
MKIYKIDLKHIARGQKCVLLCCLSCLNFQYIAKNLLCYAKTLKAGTLAKVVKIIILIQFVLKGMSGGELLKIRLLDKK